MAFPFSHPHILFGHSRFRLARDVRSVASGGGRMNHSEVSDPVWTITFTSVQLRERDLAELTAWWDNLRSGLRSALVTQNVTCRPFAHANPANAAPAQNPGNLVSVTDGNVLSVDSVDAALTLQPGDLIGLEVGAYRGLHRVVAVTGAGTTSRIITVDPPPRSYVAQAGAVVRFERPELVMRPVPGSFSVPDEGLPRVSFSFVESRQ